MLTLSELSRKMETMLEQVLPFCPASEDISEGVEGGNGNGGAHAPSSAGHSDAKQVGLSWTSKHNAAGDAAANVAHGPPPAHQSSVWTAEGSSVPAHDRLSNFYRKYNKVLLDNISIDKERDRLATENAQLEDLLQQYVDGTKLTESTLSEDNPLFVVNGR